MAISLGTMQIDATIHNVGVILPYIGTWTTEIATVEYSTDGVTYLPFDLPLGQSEGTLGRAFCGSVMRLEPETEYWVKVTVSGSPAGVNPQIASVTTMAQALPALPTPNRYVDQVNGNNSWTGLNPTGGSPNGPWKTYDHAVQQANITPNLKIQYATGTYELTVRPWLLDGTEMFAAPTAYAMDDNDQIINVGSHAILTPVSPTTNTGFGRTFNSGWVQVPVQGPATGQTFTIWRLPGAGPAGDWPARMLMFSTGPLEKAYRAAYWVRRGGTFTPTAGPYAGLTFTLSTIAGWAEFVTLGGSQNTGFMCDNTTGDFYMIAVPGITKAGGPNSFLTQTITIKNDDYDRWDCRSLNGRISGFEIRYYVGYLNGSYSLADHNLLRDCGIHTDGYKSQAERNRVEFTGLWSLDPDWPAAGWNYMKANSGPSISGQFVGAWINSGRTSTNSNSGDQESQAFMFNPHMNPIIRYNYVTGVFNGTSGSGSGTWPTGVPGFDIYENYWERIADDVYEPEGVAMNGRIYSNESYDCTIDASTGPVHYGPIYFVNNMAARGRTDGVGRGSDGLVQPSTRRFKYSGTGNPPGKIYVIHDQWHCLAGSGGRGWSQDAAGGGNRERFETYNSFFIADTYPVRHPLLTSDYQWKENNNRFYGRTVGNGMDNWDTMALYRANTGEGQFSNQDGDLHVLPSPLFVSEAAGDFRLASTSPLRGVGRVIAGLTIAGVDYGTAPNLGASLQMFTRGSTGPAPILPPEAPTTLVATPLTPTSVEVVFQDNSSDEDGFDVLMSDDAGATWQVIGEVGSDVELLTVTNLDPETSYLFRARAFKNVS
jgi:hypothetical protein